jgi:hypothetical protein
MGDAPSVPALPGSLPVIRRPVSDPAERIETLLVIRSRWLVEAPSSYGAGGVFRCILLAGEGDTWPRMNCISKGVNKEIMR